MRSLKAIYFLKIMEDESLTTFAQRKYVYVYMLRLESLVQNEFLSFLSFLSACFFRHLSLFRYVFAAISHVCLFMWTKLRRCWKKYGNLT